MGEDGELSGGRFSPGTIPAGFVDDNFPVEPVVDEENVAISFGIAGMVGVDHTSSRAFEKRPAGGGGGEMLVSFPVVAPGMSPAKVRSEEWGENLVSMGLVVIGAEPVEVIVKSNVPGVAKPS